MKPLQYVSAAVLKNPEGQVLLVQRPAGKPLAGLWEFPGGKIEDKESPEQGLQRELKEELGIMIDLNDLKPLCFVPYSYPDFELAMLCYTCSFWKGDIQLLEGQPNFSWVSYQDLKTYPMPLPNVSIVNALCA